MRDEAILADPSGGVPSAHSRSVAKDRSIAGRKRTENYTNIETWLAENLTIGSGQSREERMTLLSELLQRTYFDGIDTGDATAAVAALHEDVEWTHTQVWEHDGHTRGTADSLHGRDSVREFLAARIGEMQVEGIKHRVKQVITEGDAGAFRAEVMGPTGVSLPFFGWVEIQDGQIITYIVGPER